MNAGKIHITAAICLQTYAERGMNAEDLYAALDNRFGEAKWVAHC